MGEEVRDPERTIPRAQGIGEPEHAMVAEANTTVNPRTNSAAAPATLHRPLTRRVARRRC
jgi:hypothetical protein